MKKCRHMSQKFIVPLFSLLLVLSAFFYAPINAKASDSLVVSGSTNQATLGADGFTRIYYESAVSSISSDLTSTYVSLTFDYDVSFSFQSSVGLRNYSASIIVGDTSFTLFSKPYPANTGNLSSLTETGSCSFIVPRSALSSVRFLCNGTIPFSQGAYIPNTFKTSVVFNISNISQAAISSGGASDYQKGYDAGYSQGFDDGETSGYSDGFQAGVDSVDTESYYNSGYQAGVDSVDTQSYYDAGYQAGYNVGLQESYDTGYEDGYADAMERIENWGADGSDYPILISESTNNIVTTFHVRSGTYINGFSPSMEYYRNILALDSIDPNHTYKITFSCDNNVITKSNSNLFYEGLSYWLVVGGYEFPIRGALSSEAFCFVPGDVMSSDILFKILVDCPRFIESEQYKSADLSVDLWDCIFKVFDYGPSGNTQNHIANQTDELTNGFDDSAGQQTSSRFSQGIAEYDEVEGSLFTCAKTGLTDYQFFNLESVPAVVTGISFVTATMTGIFNSMGGASGAGIVLSVLFSVMLVSIVAGLYRYFVSSGKGGKHDRKGGKG